METADVYTMTRDEIAKARERRLSEMVDENRKLREALQWYANEENYDTGQDCPDILIDGGKYARRTLSE